MIHGGARSLAAAVLLTVSSWTLGRAALWRLTWPELRAYERAALRLTAGLGLTALLLSIVALAGWFAYAPIVIGALAAAGAVLAVIDTRRTRWTAGMSIALACALLTCAGAIAPVTDDDALAYVVPIAHHIAGSGALRVWTDQARAMWPQSQQALLAFVAQLGGDRLGAITALEWLLCLGVMSALARRVCEREEHVGAALVIALGAPVLAFQVASAKEDLLLLSTSAAAAFCLAGGSGTAELAAAGLFAGLAAGAKYPGVLVAAGAVLWPLVRRGSHPLRDCALVALCAASAGGLWYALNLWRYGNPVAPFVFGAPTTVLDARTARDFVDGYGPGRGVLNFLLAPARIFVQPSYFGGRVNWYNPLVYAGLAGLFVTPARRRNGPLFFIAAVFYTGWFMSLQNARLLLPAAVLLAPAAADRLMPLARRSTAFRALASGMAVASVGIVVAVAGVRAARYLRDPATYLARETQNYDDIRWMNAHLDPARDRVGSDHKVLAYLHVPWIFLAPTYQIEMSQEELDDPARLLEACRRQGITHLFGARDRFAPLMPHLREVYRNPSSRLGGVRFFGEPPTEETAVFVLQ